MELALAARDVLLVPPTQTTAIPHDHSPQAERTFEPNQSPDEAAHRRRRWAEALKRAREWEERTRFDG